MALCLLSLPQAGPASGVSDGPAGSQCARGGRASLLGTECAAGGVRLRGCNQGVCVTPWEMSEEGVEG